MGQPLEAQPAALLAIRDRYMLTAEVAQRLGCRNRDVRARMAAHGVESAFVLRDDRGLVWSRETVKDVLPLAG